MIFTFDATMPRNKDAVPQWVQALTTSLLTTPIRTRYAIGSTICPEHRFTADHFFFAFFTAP
jgi:hypothetical protein